MNTNHTENTGTPPTAPPCVMVIFGATGDLTKRKLIPALLNLAQEGLLSKQFAIIGFAFDQLTTDSFRSQLSSEINQFTSHPVDKPLWQWFQQRIYYVQGDFKDPNAYQRLKDQIAQVEKEHNTQGNPYYYIAVATQIFSAIVRKHAEISIAKEEKGKRVRDIVEKPFGNDVAAA